MCLLSMTMITTIAIIAAVHVVTFSETPAIVASVAIILIFVTINLVIYLCHYSDYCYSSRAMQSSRTRQTLRLACGC